MDEVQAPVSCAWLEEKLANFWPSDSVGCFLSDLECEQIGLNQGFLSHVYRLKPKWTSAAASTLPKCLVLKTASVSAMNSITDNKDADAQQKILDEWIQLQHSVECDFYDLSLTLKIPIPHPKCFYTQKIVPSVQQDGLLLLEDLSSVGMVPDFADSLTLGQALEIIEQLAKLHTWSLLHSEWKQKIRPAKREFYETSGEMIVNVLKKTHQNWPEYFGPELQPVIDLAAVSINNIYYVFGACAALDLPPVLVHGDLWSSNFLLAKADFQNQVIGFIDWQLCHPGSFAEDIGRVVTSSLSGEIRRQHEMTILNHYYSTLRSTVPADFPLFSWDDCLRAYHFTLQHSLIIGLTIIGFNCLQIGESASDLKRKKLLLLRGKFLLEDYKSILKERTCFW